MSESKILCGGFMIDDETLEEVNGVLKVKSGGAGSDEHFYWCTADFVSDGEGGFIITLNKTKAELITAAQDGKIPAFIQFIKETDLEYGDSYKLGLFTCVEIYNSSSDNDVRFDADINTLYFISDAETGLLVGRKESE